MYKQKFIYMIAGAALAAALFSGCADERLEDQLDYRKIGLNSMSTGDYEGAVDAFNKALGQCVGQIGNVELDICYYKAAAQYADGDRKGALATYQAMVDYDKENSDAYYLMGCLKLAEEDTKGALEAFENALRYAPDNYELYIGIYENLAAHHMPDEGAEYLNQIFEIKGNSGQHFAWRGKSYYLLGQYENAVKELEAALEKKNVQANLYLAQTYDALEDTANAEKYYQAYVSAGEVDASAYGALAQIEMGKENYPKALEYLEQGLALEEVPNKKELLSNQIIAYEYSGDFAAAWDVVQEYVTLYPEDAAVQREYIFLKNRQEQPEPEEIQKLQGSLGGESVPQEDTESSETADENQPNQ